MVIGDESLHFYDARQGGFDQHPRLGVLAAPSSSWSRLPWSAWLLESALREQRQGDRAGPSAREVQRGAGGPRGALDAQSCSDVADDDVEEDGQTADSKDTMTLEIGGVDKKRLEINTSTSVDKINAYNMLYQSALDLEGWFYSTRLAGGQVTRAVRQCCWVGLLTSEERLMCVGLKT
ncbi:hypothetical protein ON010_g18979 [Phytophthora cinnamomi]|nr:hypothetical protein ON010_g18979 [Phytophthora cinnamomi]